ncbi:serine protease [Histidinibacterium lentulum]|uniref:serine protease n=1 Tax=Histidinibacterium lentulum TaxID=2480588 RepID=UPI001FECB3C5|nr:serine protease [Histidinibacterium lentulum]
MTRGAISSLSGLDQDNTQMQITAPVQPGDSGGPVVDMYGHVVGVVVSRLSDRYLLTSSGSIPQNVNFAIRGEFGSAFARINMIDLPVPVPTDPLSGVDLAKRLQAATVRLDCY